MKEIRHTIQAFTYMDLVVMKSFISGKPVEEIAAFYETTVDSILTRLEDMVEKIQAEVNQIRDKMEEEQ